jgi:competence protein ComFC
MRKSLKEFLIELFFPSFCLGCGQEGTFLCYDCRSILEISHYQYCLCNKDPLRLLPDSTTGTCARCKDKKLSGLYAALPYKERALTRKLIHQFKYDPYLKSLAKDLAEILIEHFVLIRKNTDQIWENSILVPVPMEMSKMKRRGYNQAEELAKELSLIVKVPVVSKNLVKIKKTEAQMKLSAKDRSENVKDAFAIKNPAEFAGKKIFLVDDVYTTGSTTQECARVLRDAGAKKVWGVTIAREG